MQLEPYLMFHGRCEEALNFYAACLNGTVVAEFWMVSGRAS